MDNQSSRPQLALPFIPADFESMAGTSKTDLVRAVFELLAGATITGIQNESPTPYDLSAIVSQLGTIDSVVEGLLGRTPRRITLAGVNNGLVIAPFQDVGTTNYQVDLAFVWPSGSPFPAIQWAVVEGSKQMDQVSLRIDGTAGTFTLEVTITPLDNL